MKASAKRLLGRIIPVDLAEKLTEYAINEQVKALSLAEVETIPTPSREWNEGYGRGRFRLWDRTLERLPAADVLLLEFGVWKGDSIRQFLRMIPSPNSLFYGFDSFVGLPEAWRGTAAGYWSTSGEMPDIPDARVRFVKGWFRDTLPSMQEELRGEAQGRTVLVHIDCDLYSSTLFVLFELARLFDPFAVIFDEYSGHEARALYNFTQASGAKVEFLCRMDWEGCPAVVSAILSSTPHQPR